MFTQPSQAQKLEEALKYPGSPNGTQDEVQALVQLAQNLSTLPKATVPLSHRRRQYLLDHLAAPVHRGIRLVNWTGYFAGATLAFGLVLTSLFAWSSQPGSALYPYKNRTQNLRAHLVSNQTERASLQLAYAEHRLEETEAVLSSDADTKTKAAALTQLAAETEETVEAVKKVALEKNDRELLDRLASITDKQTAVATTTANDPAVETAAKTAIASAKASSKTVAEARQIMAAANESSMTKLPGTTITITGAISKISDTELTIGEERMVLPEEVKITNGTSPLARTVLKVGVRVAVTSVQGEQELRAKVITIVAEEGRVKGLGTDNGAGANEAIPDERVDGEAGMTIPTPEAEETKPEVQSGFQIEDPTPQYPKP